MLKTILLSLFLVGSHHFDTVTPTPSPTINQAPQLKGYEIRTQIATEDEVFEFDVPVEDIFYDDDELTYSTSEAKKDTLPTWLAFNDELYSFFGIPSETDIGNYNISLTATDQSGLEASTYFLIEVMRQNEDEDTLFFEDITGIILGFLAAISPCIVDGIAYARWRIKKKAEEEEDRQSSLLTCEKYRSECCNGNFKFLNCYNKCDGCCSTIFSCLCDDCCKAYCKEYSCNCCNHYHTVQVVKKEKDTTSNQKSESEKLKIETETLSNQLNEKNQELDDLKAQLQKCIEQNTYYQNITEKLNKLRNEFKMQINNIDIQNENSVKSFVLKVQEELKQFNEDMQTLRNWYAKYKGNGWKYFYKKNSYGISWEKIYNDILKKMEKIRQNNEKGTIFSSILQSLKALLSTKQARLWGLNEALDQNSLKNQNYRLEMARINDKLQQCFFQREFRVGWRWVE